MVELLLEAFGGVVDAGGQADKDRFLGADGAVWGWGC